MADATFLIRRGERTVRGITRAHLARFNAHGQIVGAWCHRTGFDFNSNVPLGLTICKDCLRLWRAAS